jgi:hypothetical protein
MLRFGWVLVLAGGCDDNLFGIADDFGTTTPEVTGYAGVQQIAADHCFACHGAGVATQVGNGLDLETDLHAAVVGVTGAYGVPLVIPGDSANSLLYLKLTGQMPDNTGGVMPPGGVLATGTTDLVADWIDDGATTE